jgi:hypothetical protein
MGRERTLGLTTRPRGSWVQTELAAHEKWAKLAVSNPRASSVLHVLLAHMGRGNAVVISQKTLAKLAECSRATLQRALEALKEGNWIEVRQIGVSGTTNAYIINDRVAWYGNRDGRRYSLFSATVVVSEEEQPDREELGRQERLQRIPELYPGEHLLPAGDGLPPPSEPALPGFESEIPPRRVPFPEPEQMNVETYLSDHEQD